LGLATNSSSCPEILPSLIDAVNWKRVLIQMVRLDADPYCQDGLWNIVVVGDKKVGKSRLVNSLARSAQLAVKAEHRPNDDDPVIDAVSGIYRLGIDYVTRRVALDSDVIIKLQVWDGNALGNGHYASVPFKHANLVLLVFDVTVKSTFERIPTILKTTLQNLEAQGSSNAAILLLGNVREEKVTNKRVVSYEVAKRYANERGMIYVEADAADLQSVDTAFTRITVECLSLSYLGDVTFSRIRQRRITQVPSRQNQVGGARRRRGLRRDQCGIM